MCVARLHVSIYIYALTIYIYIYIGFLDKVYSQSSNEYCSAEIALFSDPRHREYQTVSACCDLVITGPIRQF